jgi:hypothetical protein
MGVMTNYKAQNPKPSLLLCHCEVLFPSVIVRLAEPAEAISAKPLCHCEECSDEAI